MIDLALDVLFLIFIVLVLLVGSETFGLLDAASDSDRFSLGCFVLDFHSLLLLLPTFLLWVMNGVGF